MTLLCLVTLLALNIQMTRIFLSTKQLISYQMGVLFLAACESGLGVLHWGFFSSTYFNFFMVYLKEIQLLVITYFFDLSALVAFDRRDLEKRLLWPVFGGLFIYQTLVVMLGASGLLKRFSNDLDCSDPTFFLLSFTGLLLSSVFLATGIAITRKMKRQSISENIRRRKRLELWALIFVYFVVSLSSSLQDVTDLILSYTRDSCTIFPDSEWLQSLVQLMAHICNLLLPIWATLIVYNVEARRVKGRSLQVATLVDPTSAHSSLGSFDDLYIGAGTSFHAGQSYYSVNNTPHLEDYEDDGLAPYRVSTPTPDEDTNLLPSSPTSLYQ